MSSLIGAATAFRLSLQANPMSKTSSLVLTILLAGVSAAAAQGRPDSTRMRCAEAAALVQRSGSLVLGTGGMTYDRYVSDRRFCEPTQTTKAAFAPTADAPFCMVGYTCIEPFTSQTDPSPK